MRPKLGFALVTLLLLIPFAAKADDVKVFVGYADNLRPSGFFPSPFCGDASVTVCQAAPLVPGTMDAGAIRILDTSGAPITISNLTVTLNPGTGPVVFKLWTDATINPGENAIFGQTASFNFDTSDFGFLGAVGIDASHPLGGCTNPGALNSAQKAACIANEPIVKFLANGTPLSFTDTGTILNTFGYDFINGSSDGNESINWNVIGASPTRGGGTTPEPATSTMMLLGSGLLAWFRRRTARA
jgi:PEP-CTERM motif